MMFTDKLEWEPTSFMETLFSSNPYVENSTLLHDVPAQYGLLKNHAGTHLLPEAGAMQERSLEAIRCSAWFGLAAKFCLANTLAPDVNGRWL